MGVQVIAEIKARSRPFLQDFPAHGTSELFGFLLDNEASSGYVVSGECVKNRLVYLLSVFYVEGMVGPRNARCKRKIIHGHGNRMNLRVNGARIKEKP